MASIRTPILRHLTQPSLRAARFITHQRRWAQVHDVRFLATTRPSQDVLDRYRSKLDEKAQSEGFESIDKLKSAYADKIREAQKRDAADFPIPQAPETPVKQPFRGPLPGLETPGEAGEANGGRIPQAPETPVTQPNVDSPLGQPEIPQADGTPVTQPNKGQDATHQAARRASGADKAQIKMLDDYINVEKVRDLPEPELTAIWRLRHAQSEHKLCAVAPAAAYRTMEQAAREAPQFVLPVPHEGQGAEIHFVQWTFDAPSRTSTVLFTQLAEYKARGEFAQPHTTVTHHLDLADDRGLVFMQGQVMEGRGIQPEQAKWLVLCLQRFYGGWEAGEAEIQGERKQRAEERKKLLSWFASGDERFTVEKLLEEAERMG
ncbi:putative F1F0 ATP synthase assembly protein Atp11 [Emericellopsis atlantica]|uniref:F1F0 ATP synthase assembly protein Atp11 n=1 Tax=Emericellopsis atlantica TaxID=2614577 RepID=A0A9P7ZGG5_9HYPO|nr:putative F1F0 ATP synthase assembly protein Atp11 [Emericellopsis atlantica]KAG9251560.1 putative F1F0 ATP synthase assembly protein Atp11 [Emericellopsis atlantica]